MTITRPVGPQNDHSLQVDACKAALATGDLSLKDSEVVSLFRFDQLEHVVSDKRILNSRGKFQFHGKEIACEPCE